MKKLKKIMLVLTILAMLPIGVFAKEKVNVYLFKREGCGYCANALTFFNTLSEDEEYKNYFNLVTKEVLNNKTNSTLMEKTAKKLGVSLEGVPFIVIGNTHFEGYSNTFDEQIKEAIKNAYESDAEDVVATLLEEKDTSAVTIVIIIAVVAGIAFLIYMAKDKTEEQEEVAEEVVKEKVVPKKKPQAKKTTKKTTTSKKTTSKTTTAKKKTNKK